MGREKRKSLRDHVIDREVNGLMTKEGDQHRQPFLIWDISSDGLCIWSGEPVTPGEIVILTIVKPVSLLIRCRVKWSANKEVQNGFRSGLEVLADGGKMPLLLKKLRYNKDNG